MKRLLLISQPSSYRIAPYISAAQNRGLSVLVASRGEYSLISEVYQGLHIDFEAPDEALERILTEAQVQPFHGIIGTDDSTVELAANAARKLGLPHNPPQAARITRRKDLARDELALAGCPIPIHCLVDLSQALDPQMKGMRSKNLHWPCVIKPLNMSASRGVIRVNNENEFIDACQRIKNIIAESSDEFERSHVLVEDYIDGIEVAFEGYLENEQLHTLAIFDKPDPLQGPYFQETIYVTPSRLDDSTQEKIKQRVQQTCAAIRLTTGPVHAELRIDERDAWILEVASRTIGGDCARMLDNGDANSLEELTIALATDTSVNHEALDTSRGVMMIPVPRHGILRRVEGLLAAQKVAHIDKVDIIVHEGHELIPLPEGNQYAGYIFASAKTPEQVEAALREAHAKLNFVVAPMWKISAE